MINQLVMILPLPTPYGDKIWFSYRIDFIYTLLQLFL